MLLYPDWNNIGRTMSYISNLVPLGELIILVYPMNYKEIPHFTTFRFGMTAIFQVKGKEGCGLRPQPSFHSIIIIMSFRPRVA